MNGKPTWNGKPCTVVSSTAGSAVIEFEDGQQVRVMGGRVAQQLRKLDEAKPDQKPQDAQYRREQYGRYLLLQRMPGADWRVLVEQYSGGHREVYRNQRRDAALAYIQQHSGEPAKPVDRERILALTDPDRLFGETVAIDVEAFAVPRNGYRVFRRFADQHSVLIEERFVSGPNWWWRRKCEKARKHWKKLQDKGMA